MLKSCDWMEWGSDWAEAGKPGFELGRFNLQFRDPRAELLFQRDTLAQSIRFVRAYQFAGILLYMAFGLLDVVLGDPGRFSVLVIRLGLVTPILVVVFLLTFRADFYRIMQPALALAMMACGMGVVAMTAIMGPPSNTLYYAGLILIVSYCGNLIRLNFLYSAAVSAWLLGCYQVVALWLNPIPVPVFIANDFFLAMASGVGLFAAYIQERYMRQAYAAQKLVEEKNWLVSESLAEAMRANKSRGEFLATMSHELRTPLNAIIGFSDIISRELFGPIRNSKYTEYARDIHESGAHLLSIINDLLDLAKAESGKLELSETEFDAAETLRASMRMCQMRATESGVRLVFGGVSHEVRIIADERMLLQVFSNLITNAIKFTPEGGTVRMQVSGEPENGVAFRIGDTGIGIAPENLERVLRPFEQVETSYSRRHGGVGLGLPYAKRLTELHGGALEIESQIGKGTTITVRLPSWRLVGTSADAVAAA
ncbi:MAG TPA: HAMP domain-containing sensor histidine kinase [Micropepsaceae bacterium]|nr:HAMP domain-containing sensor histidine kinase [Micropepsaceae bacterium]